MTDQAAGNITIVEVVRAAGKWIVAGGVGLISFLAVRTLDRIEMNQQEQQRQNLEILQQLAGINSDSRHRDQMDIRTQQDIGSIRDDLRQFEQRIGALEGRRR